MSQVIKDTSSYPFSAYKVEYIMFPTFWDVFVGEIHPRGIPKIEVGRIYFNWGIPYSFVFYGTSNKCSIPNKECKDLEEVYNTAISRFQTIYKDTKPGDDLVKSMRGLESNDA
jgi:hypothetical protein